MDKFLENNGTVDDLVVIASSPSEAVKELQEY